MSLPVPTDAVLKISSLSYGGIPQSIVCGFPSNITLILIIEHLDNSTSSSVAKSNSTDDFVIQFTDGANLDHDAVQFFSSASVLDYNVTYENQLGSQTFTSSSLALQIQVVLIMQFCLMKLLKD